MNSFLSTGQFAKLTNTTKRTLFHYDKLGLLTPKLINTKGDRWYSKDQISAFNLIKLIQTSGIPLKEIIRELKNANYSYKKLYKNYANTIGSTITAEEQSFSMILDRYSNSSRLLKYYEPFISPHINVFLLKISTNFADAITLIDKIDNYFNNINNDSTAYVEINNLSDFSIGMVKEGNITPKSKYKNSFQLSSLLPVKSLKRTYIQSKINEERAVKNLILAGRTIDPEIKQIRLFMHNRNIEHQKYLCDSYFIL